MNENMENEATNELSPASSLSDRLREIDVVDQISTNMMGLLGQIEDFVGTIHDDALELEPTPQPHSISLPYRLENAMRFLKIARDEVCEELHNNRYEAELDDFERENNMENSGDASSEHENKLCTPLDVLKSHIDDGIKLRQVNCEMTRVMDIISSRFKQIGAKVTDKSSIDTEIDTGTAVAGVTGICSLAIEDRADGQELQQNAELDAVHDTDDFLNTSDGPESIHLAGTNVNKIAEDMKHVSEDISSAIAGAVHNCSNASVMHEEKENCEVREKSEFEETEKSDFEASEKNDLARTNEPSEENKGMNIPEEETVASSACLDYSSYDSSCGSTTGDETEPDTTTDDEGTNAIWLRARNPNTILLEHLARDRIEVEYQQVNDEEERSYSSKYNYMCKVLDMETVGEGRSKQIAKLQVAVHMLSLIVRRQTNGTLPPAITPFSESELRTLEPILASEVEINPINILRKECTRLREKMPSFKTLSHSGPSGEHMITVQCTTLNLTAVGCGRNKRRARRDAANNILSQYYKSNSDQELP